MKKGIYFILALVICITCTSCGKNIPENMSEEAYDLGIDMLNLVDKYMAGKISQDEAKETMDSYIYTLFDIVDKVEDDLAYDAIEPMMFSAMSCSLFFTGNISDSYEDFMGYRNALAESLNKPAKGN